MDEEALRITIKTNLLSEVPFQIHMDKEHYYHSIFIVWLKTLGFKVFAEDSTNQGSIDCVLIRKNETILIEIKHSKSEKENDLKSAIKDAFKSIHNRNYFEKYLKSENLKLLAIAFNRKEVLCEFETKI